MAAGAGPVDPEWASFVDAPPPVRRLAEDWLAGLARNPAAPPALLIRLLGTDAFLHVLYRPDLAGFAALIERAHHDRTLRTRPDGEDGAVLGRGFPNNGHPEWRVVTPGQPVYSWPLRIAAERDGRHLCTFLPFSPAGGEPVAAPPVAFTIRAEPGGDGDGGAVPLGPMNGMGYRRPPVTVAFADLRRQGLPEVVLTHLWLPEGAVVCDADAFGAMIEDAYRTPGTLHVHPDLDADGNEQCIGIGAERSWRWEMARRPAPADDGEYYGGLHNWVTRLLLAPERDPATWPAFAALLPHAHAAIATTSDATGRLARSLEESGDYRGARALWSRIADARAAADGPEHPRTLVARCQQARCTGAAGDAVTARDALAELLPLAEDVLGPDAPDTLAARHDLAAIGSADDGGRPGARAPAHGRRPPGPRVLDGASRRMTPGNSQPSAIAPAMPISTTAPTTSPCSPVAAPSLRPSFSPTIDMTKLISPNRVTARAIG